MPVVHSLCAAGLSVLSTMEMTLPAPSQTFRWQSPVT
jgi:hypothetical protein